MKAVSFLIPIWVAFIITTSAQAQDTKPLESPIHMTILPVPDEFRNAPEAPQSALAKDDSSASHNASETPVLVHSEASRDDTDADLARGGRR